MTTATADPKARELDDAFAKAMSGPARPRAEPKTPPEIDPEAPFGREDDGTPIAKYGYRNDGSIRLTGAGRPSRNAPDRARVDDRPAPPVTADGKPAAEDDYTADLIGTAQGAWLCLTAASKLPLGKLRLGKFGLPPDASERMAAQAYLLDQSKVQLAMALGTAAKHNARARAWARKLASEDATWMLTVASLAGPFFGASLDLWKGSAPDPEKAETIKNMAAANNETMEEVKAQFQAMVIRQQAEVMALAQANGQLPADQAQAAAEPAL